MDAAFVLTLSDENATLPAVGGKAASLSRLARAGLPVPAGFYLTTAAYNCFIAANRLQPVITQALTSVDAAQVDSLEAAERVIREGFLAGRMPAEISLAAAAAYEALPGEHPYVAVRSSATAEDLPEASFAGQQETYLNIHGLPALLEAVQKCWASLWTARAIAYRLRNHVDQESVSLAVVIQNMVFAGGAGILFTANPTNGRRDELLINAAWGLGEAVVSGAVTPDTIVVDRVKRKVTRRETAEKKVMTVRSHGGTVEAPVPAESQNKPVLNDARALQLAALGEQIEALYGQPMDIEWALWNGKFFVLQARPITQLPPAWTLPHPKSTYARGSLAEHLPNPVTPLFGTLGLRLANQATAELADSLGFNALELNYQYIPINGYVFMGFFTNPAQMWKMMKGSWSVWKGNLRRSREDWHAARQSLDSVIEFWDGLDPDGLSNHDLLRSVNELFLEVGRLYTVLQAGTLPAATSSEVVFGRLYRLARRNGDPEHTAFLFGYNTRPVQAEKALFDLAAWVKTQPELAAAFTSLLAASLLERPESVPAAQWDEWQARLVVYLREYGSAVYELDFANPTPAETPIVALDAVKMYLRGGGQNPYQRQAAAEAARLQAEQRLLPRLHWPLKGWVTRSLNWAQKSAPDREDSLVDLGRANPLIRRLLGELGRRLTAAGAIPAAENIYWLEEPELVALIQQLDASAALPDHSSLVAARKAAWQQQMKLTPPAMLPEKSFLTKLMPWHKTDQTGPTISGLGASAGKVTAPACVLLSPADFSKMTPGAVLVAVTTTPAWTPLFSLASAVVTDIGGPLSHSSIVAREYGIPAVMATGLGTRRIHDGQLVTVDGSTGIVTLHPNEAE